MIKIPTPLSMAARRSGFIFLTAMLLFASILPALAQESSSHYNLNKKKVAIDGFDPVSYFDNSPAEGSASYTAAYEGATYYFINAENQKRFSADPEAFIPQYGGWCAYAMGADGSKVKVDPKTYKITEGKLYLFYNFGKTNTLVLWNDDEEKLTNQANDYWNSLTGR